MLTKNSGTTTFTMPSGLEIVCERIFDAPRELVFRVSNDPDLIPKWWGPSRFETAAERMEVKPGGSWRILHRDSDGNQYGFHGVYHDVVAPERTVRTFEFEGVPGHVLLETATLEDLGGTTKVRVQSVFQTVEDRDGMLNSGMQSGATESHDRLAALLKELQGGRGG